MALVSFLMNDVWLPAAFKVIPSMFCVLFSILKSPDKRNCGILKRKIKVYMNRAENPERSNEYAELIT